MNSGRSPFPGGQGIGLKVPTLITWLVFLVTSAQPAPTSRHLSQQTKYTLITQEMTKVLGALCQEPGTKTKCAFLFTYIFTFPLRCHPGHSDQNDDGLQESLFFLEFPFSASPPSPSPWTLLPQFPSKSQCKPSFFPPSLLSFLLSQSTFTEHPRRAGG